MVFPSAHTGSSGVTEQKGHMAPSSNAGVAVGIGVLAAAMLGLLAVAAVFVLRLEGWLADQAVLGPDGVDLPPPPPLPPRRRGRPQA